MKATTINDLIVQSEERQLLWQALRERVVYNYGVQEIPEINLPEEILAALLGIKEGEIFYKDDDEGLT